MPRRVDAYRGLAQSSRLRVLHELLVRPGQPLADLAVATGLHENTLRDHLRVLEDEGFVVRRTLHRGSRGRPPMVFDPVRPEDAPPQLAQRIEDAKRHGDLLRRMLGDESSPELDGDALHQIDALYEHLDDVGLEPEVDEKALTVDLVPCPFHDLVDGRENVVCAVHTALIQNVLEQAGGPLQLELLSPFVTRHSCRIQLQQRPDQAAASG